jgi:hypothetical protein
MRVAHTFVGLTGARPTAGPVRAYPPSIGHRPCRLRREADIVLLGNGTQAVEPSPLP